MFDILNEPDSLGLRWEAHTSAAGAALPSVADAYHQVMAAGYAVNPGGRRGKPCLCLPPRYFALDTLATLVPGCRVS